MIQPSRRGFIIGFALLGLWLGLFMIGGPVLQYAEQSVRTAVHVAYGCKDRGRSEAECTQDVKAALY